MEASRNMSHRSWNDVKQSVRGLRRQFCSLSAKVPTSVTFRQLPDNRTRIYFLSSGCDSTLMFCDILDSHNNENSKVQCQLLIEPTFCLMPHMGHLSKEEQLMLERKRLVSSGITAYEFHNLSGMFLIPAASTLFHCNDSGVMSGSLFPREIQTSCGGVRMNAQICPSNPDLVAFVCNGDVWITHIRSGCEKRVTFSHKGSRNLSDDPLSSGMPSYVMLEEFDRYIGFWWQPQTKDGFYRLLYEEVDESEVDVLHFSSSSTGLGNVEEYRFPRAGTPNAKSTLKMIQFRVSPTQNLVTDVMQLEMRSNLNMFFPWMEYLIRVGWTPDGDYVWAQLLDRRQQKLELILIPLEAFQPSGLDYHIQLSHDSLPPVQVIYSLYSDIWLNVHDILSFLPLNIPGQIKFIFASRETGYRHLYLITAQIFQAADSTNSMEDCLEGYLRPRILQKVALTTGDWEVLDKPIWVDEKHDLVYFVGLKDTPLERHLYVVSMNHPGELRRLTTPGYSHILYMNKSCSLLLSVYSNVRTMPASQVFRLTHSDTTVEGVQLTPVGYMFENKIPLNYNCPELFSHRISSGDVIYGLIFKPTNFTPGQKYPTVVSVYGGPEVQVVTNSFEGMRQVRMHMLAAQGFCVVTIDSRGSCQRGLQFESHIKGRMGTVEIQDQVEVLHWLSHTIGYVDINRIGIHGWSYGGYLSLMALAQFPDVFKVLLVLLLVSLM